jgi:hypothetical protein
VLEQLNNNRQTQTKQTGNGNGNGDGYGESDPYPLDAVDLLIRLSAREAVTHA